MKMNTYTRQGEMTREAQAAPSETENEADRVAINGFQQVLDMLRVADPQFRESLLRRIAAKDARLANSLRQDLYRQSQ